MFLKTNFNASCLDIYLISGVKVGLFVFIYLAPSKETSSLLSGKLDLLTFIDLEPSLSSLPSELSSFSFGKETKFSYSTFNYLDDKPLEILILF